MVNHTFLPSCRATIAQTNSKLIQELAKAGVENAQLEARQLLVEAAGLQREDLVVRPQMLLDEQQLRSVWEWLGQRASGTPLARIRGWQEFYGRRFYLSSETLEPRQDSETLIDTALELMNARQCLRYPWRILDIGTGTGCLALTLLAERPNATATGVDICASALKMARHNAISLGLEKRAKWLRSNYLENVSGVFDLIISNPPYIRHDDIQRLQVEVKKHDPNLALDGGVDGLEAYRVLAANLVRVVPRGFAIIEIACNDAARVIETFGANRNNNRVKVAGVWQDLSGCDRCVAFQTIS